MNEMKSQKSIPTFKMFGTNINFGINLRVYSRKLGAWMEYISIPPKNTVRCAKVDVITLHLLSSTTDW